MAVYHKFHRSMGLSAFGQSFKLDDKGKLSPEPDAETAAAFGRLTNYEVDAAAPSPKVEPEAEPKAEPKPEAEPEAEAEPKVSAFKKRRTRKKKSSA
jgi:hypothetical protein